MCTPVFIQCSLIIFKRCLPFLVVIWCSCIWVNIFQVYCFEVQCRYTVFPVSAAIFFIYRYVVHRKGFFSELCQFRFSIFVHIPCQPFDSCRSVCLTVQFDSFRRIQPVDKICHSLRIFCIASDRDHLCRVSFRTASVGEDLHILYRSQHKSFSGRFVLSSIIVLSNPRPWTIQHLAICIFCRPCIIILSRRIRIYQSSLICLIEEIKYVYIDRIIIKNTLFLCSVCLGKYKSDFIISIHACWLFCIVHHIVIPVFEQGDGIDIITAFFLTCQLLHIFQYIQKSIQIFHLRISEFFVVIPADIWSECRFQSLA